MDVLSSLCMIDVVGYFYLTKKWVKGEEQTSHFVTWPFYMWTINDRIQALKL